MTPRRILVPVDFSEGSRAALDYAIRLAQSLGAHVETLAVWQPPSYLPLETPLELNDSGLSRSIGDVARCEFLLKLRLLVSQVDGRPGEPIPCRVEVGEPSEVIVTLAESGGYDLLVLGARAGSPSSGAALGSVAERVVRHSPIPVATIRAQAAAQ
jgi:nucleotide-binding universal stress UspA family protein